MQNRSAADDLLLEALSWAEALNNSILICEDDTGSPIMQFSIPVGADRLSNACQPRQDPGIFKHSAQRFEIASTGDNLERGS